MNHDLKLSMNKLTGDNYFVWKFRMQILLEREDVWSVIVEEAPDPVVPEWTKKDKNAKAIICMLVDDKEIINTRGCATAQQMWECLRKTYEHSGLTNKLHLMRKLFSIRYSDSKNMREHINHILELVERLQNIGEIVKDWVVIAILLSNLPITYDPLITSMEARGSSDLTLAFVKERLLDEAHRKENREEFQEKTDGAAMYTHYEPKKCYRCGNPGHFKRDCKQRPNTNQRERYSNNSNQSNTYYQTPERGYPNKGGKYDNPNTVQTCQTDNEEELTFSAHEGTHRFTCNKWLVDSGASSHLTQERDLLSEYQQYLVPKRIEVANGDSMHAMGEGNLMVMFGDGKLNTRIDKLTKVMFVPEAKTNILSVSKLCEDNYTLKFHNHTCTLLKGNDVQMSYQTQSSVFFLPLRTCPRDNFYPAQLSPEEYHSVSSAVCIHQWHERMGHRDLSKIKSMSDNNTVRGLSIKQCSHSDFCRDCNIGKSKQRTFPNSEQNHYTKNFQLIHTDLCGPIKPKTVGEGHYFLTLTDDYSKHTTTRILNNKTQVTEMIIQYLRQGYNNFGYFPKALRSDGGGEFENTQLNNYLQSKGIVHQLAVPYTPQQNGLAERKNQTLLNMARCMISQSNLPKSLWGEAIVMATYLCNLIPVGSSINTPYEIWEGYKPDLKHLRPFGMEAYTYNPLVLRHKLDDTATRGFMVGYAERHKGYRIWNPMTQKIKVSRSVNFKEDDSGKIDLSTEDRSEEIPIELEQPIELPALKEDKNSIELRRSERLTSGIPPKRLSY